MNHNLIKIFEDTQNTYKTNSVLIEAGNKTKENQICYKEGQEINCDKNRFPLDAKIVLSTKRTFEAAEKYVKEGKRVSNPIVTKTIEHTPDELFRTLLVFPTTPMIVYRRELISNNQLRFNNDIKCGEVYDFTISVMEYANRIKLLLLLI